MNRADIVAKIVTARDEAAAETHYYRTLASKRYEYWRAVSTALTYDETLAMFARATEHKIAGMAIMADEIADYTHAYNDDEVPESGLEDETTEMSAGHSTLAMADGRRDALASVADWMNTEESNR